MSDQYTVTTTKSWGQRMKGAVAGFFIGPLLIVGSIVLLWTNEWRSVKVANGLTEGSKMVISTTSTPIDASLDGKLVHTSGRVATQEVLNDSLIWVSENAIALSRKVEMYQWKEKSSTSSKDNYGWSETSTTTYTYTKEWSDHKIKSSSFNDPINHRNPTEWIYDQYDILATNVKIWDMRLSRGFIEQMTPRTQLSLSSRNIVLSGATVLADSIYFGKVSSDPAIGDMRIKYYIAPLQDISIIGKLSGDMLEGYKTKTDSEIALLEIGTHWAVEMFQNAQDENMLFTWLFRVGGIILLFIGFSLIFQIIVILAKVIPFLATIVGWGTSLISFLATIIVGGIVIASAWIFARPLISGVVFVIIGGIVFFIFQNKKSASGWLVDTTGSAPMPQ